MQFLPVDLLAEGMTLAKPVANDKGAVLLPEGTVLTGALIGRLERMNVPKVAVEGHPVDLPGAEPAKSPEERVAELNKAFSKVENNPAMMAVKAVYVDLVLNPPKKEQTGKTPEPPGGDT